MSKSTKSTTKATKTSAKKAESKAAFAAAVKAQKAEAPKAAPKALPTATEAKEKAAPKAPKHTAIKSGGTIQINEAVGIHFRADAETAPAEGDMVLLAIGNSEVPLIVSCTKALVDGSTLIQAFITKKSGDHAILGAAKGESATVIWK